MASVELQGLHKEFGNVVALDDLDLDVAAGEFVSLLGPSGCGKTTALRCVAGFEFPDSGEVLVDGKDVLGLPANKRNMGMVFQAYSLFPNMTAQQNVEFSMKIRRRPRSERSKRALELLELVGLSRQAERYPRQLSGGQQQRVALARALALEPAVLLLDEPLSALDAKVRVQLREEVRRIQLELGITTLYVTHDQEEALSVSDRVAVLSEGRIEQIGTPAEVYTHPKTSFVASFVGTVNRAEVTVLSASGKTVRWGPAVLKLETEAFAYHDGDAVTLYLRPEDVTLGLGRNGTIPSGGLFNGRVTSITFLGPVTRVSVRTEVGPVVADLSSAEALELSIDSEVSVDVAPGALRALAS
jgi:putative spermidine/putrescine transport system ATP-binding protein